jgi:hypothetical protein
VTRCYVVQSMFDQNCRTWSKAGVMQNHQFMVHYTVEPAACRNWTGTFGIGEQEYKVEWGAIKSHTKFIKDSLDLGRNCEMKVN